MEDSGLAAIASYVMREKRAARLPARREGVLTLEKMYFADEIRTSTTSTPERVVGRKQELEMAAELIERFTGTSKPEKYEDTYRDALLDVIEAKRKGKEVHVERGERSRRGPAGGAPRERRGVKK